MASGALPVRCGAWLQESASHGSSLGDALGSLPGWSDAAHRPQNATPVRSAGDARPSDSAADAARAAGESSPAGTRDTLPSPSLARPLTQSFPRSIGLRFATAAATTAAVIALLLATDSPEQIEAKILAAYISGGPLPNGRAVLGVSGIDIPLPGGVGRIHSTLNFQDIVTAAEYAGAVGATVILDCVPMFVLAVTTTLVANVRRASSAPDSASSAKRRRHATPDAIRRVHVLAREHPEWSPAQVVNEVAATLKEGERAPSASTVRMFRKRGAKQKRHFKRALSDEHEQVLVDWMVGRSVGARASRGYRAPWCLTGGHTHVVLLTQVIGDPVDKTELFDVANGIRADDAADHNRVPPIPLGDHWHSCFLARHPEIMWKGGVARHSNARLRAVTTRKIIDFETSLKRLLSDIARKGKSVYGFISIDEMGASQAAAASLVTSPSSMTYRLLWWRHQRPSVSAEVSWCKRIAVRSRSCVLALPLPERTYT
jgi:hypothetical protein